MDNDINFPNLICTSNFIKHNEPKCYNHYGELESFKDLMAAFISTLFYLFLFIYFLITCQQLWLCNNEWKDNYRTIKWNGCGRK